MEKHRDRQKKDRQTLTDRHEEMKGHPHKQVLNKIKTKLESKKKLHQTNIFTDRNMERDTRWTDTGQTQILSGRQNKTSTQD